MRKHSTRCMSVLLTGSSASASLMAEYTLSLASTLPSWCAVAPCLHRSALQNNPLTIPSQVNELSTAITQALGQCLVPLSMFAGLVVAGLTAEALYTPL